MALDNYEMLINAGIDIETLLNRLMGNEALIKVFVNKFLLDKTYEELAAAFEKNDAGQAEIKSHTLKGMCGNMSLQALYELFTRQVNLIRGGEFERARSMMLEIEPKYETAVSLMREWISKQ